MKRILVTLTTVLLTLNLFAQSPEKMSYQAVIRNSENSLIANQQIGIRISILQGNINGTAVYIETQNPTTNSNGLISIEIGGNEATIISGVFASIDWANGPYYIKNEIDPDGGSTYTISGTNQLLSVPYALYAKSAGNLSGTYAFATSNALEDTASAIRNDMPHHYIGELYLDGIVFYVYNNGRNGLVASLNDLDGGTGVTWSDNTTTEIGATNFHDGVSNTDQIIAQQSSTSAAQLCRNLGSDWYLPSIGELQLLYANAYATNKILNNDGDNTTNGLSLEEKTKPYGWYWSSTEYNATMAYFQIMSENSSASDLKSTLHRVRAVRAF